MGTIVTLKPNGTAANAWTVFGSGPPPAHTALSDGTASSGVTTTSHDVDCLVDMETYTLAANERCIRARVGTQGYGESASLLATTKVNTFFGTGRSLDYGTPATGIVVVEYGSWYTNTPDLGEWVQSKIDSMQLNLKAYMGASGSPFLQVDEARVQLDIRTKPTVTISSPTVNQVMPSLPVSVAWTYSGDGDVQKKYRVKVFTKAVAEGVGFDVTTSTPVFDSGLTSGSGSSVATSGLVNGGEYYAFVQVAKDFNGTDWLSDWSTGRPFKVNSAPVADVVTPTGTVTDTSRPTITWNYTDEEGDAQTHYEARVYEEPAGGWTGFDPDTTTEPLVWGSGEVASSSSSIQIGTPLDNPATYRAYVRVKQSTPSVVYSSWNYEDFTTNLTPASTPSVSAVSYEDRIDVTVTPGGASTPAADWLVAERSLDGGTTWETFRFGSLVLSDPLDAGSGALVLTDYEVPLGSEVLYRAYSVTTDSGSEVASPYSTSASGTATGKKIWLKDPSDSSLGQHFIVETDWAPVTRYRSRTPVRPMGRDLPVVIRGTGKGIAITLNFLVFGTDMDSLLDLIYSDRTLFLQTPKGIWYVELSGDVSQSDHLWDSLRGEEDVRRVTVPFIEVEI